MAYELGVLLGGYSPGGFLREQWGRAPLHIKGEVSRYHELFTHDFSVPEIRRICRALIATKGGHAYGYPNTNAARSAFAEHGDEPVLVAAPDSALDLVRSGITTTLPGLEQVEPRLAEICAALRSQMQAVTEIDCRLWMSGPDAGARTHMDGPHIFQCQLYGRKRWRIATAPVLPWTRGYNVARLDGSARLHTDWGEVVDARVEDCRFQELVMESGDFLYLPGGTWHSTRAVGAEMSVSLSFGFKWSSFRQVLDRLLDDALGARVGWRQMPPPVSFDAGAGGHIPPEVSAYFAERLDEVRAVIDGLAADGPALNRAWKRLIAQGRPEREWHVAMTTIRDPVAPVEPDHSLQVVPSSPLTIAECGTEIYLFHGDEEICFDNPEYFDFARGLARQTRPFAARDALTWSQHESYTWSDIQPMLDTLAEIGLLRRIS